MSKIMLALDALCDRMNDNNRVPQQSSDPDIITEQQIIHDDERKVMISRIKNGKDVHVSTMKSADDKIVNWHPNTGNESDDDALLNKLKMCLL